MPQLAYLGPQGTFTHQAAKDLAEPGETPLPLPTAIDVIRAVAAGEAEGGVVALENSLEGSVTANLDEILRSPGCVLAGERVLPVSFALLRAPGDDAPLTGVASHPFGLAQCSRFIREHGLEVRETASTAGAGAELAAEPRPGWGAIGPHAAAEAYGLRVEREALEDVAGPATRFVLLRGRSPAATGRDRSAFVVRPRRDEPGSLVRVLQEFAVRGINLTTIHSRPTKLELGEYDFFIECEGHITDPRLRDAVLALVRVPGETRFLGSFPVDPRVPGPVEAEPPNGEALQAYDEMLQQVT
jgi:prephenate dehydratase